MLGYRLNKLGAAMRGNKPIVALRFDDPTRALDSRITFSRASSATYFDSAGVLQTAGSGVARAHAYQDYNPSTLAPLGFLIEEQRTNLFLSSEDFRSSGAGNPVSAWGNSNITVTANGTTSPDGTGNADYFIVNVAGNALSQNTQSFTAGSTITFTLFAKKRTSNFVRFEIGGLVNCWFNLNTGATASNSAGSGNVLFSSKSIQALPNGWYRCQCTVTTTVITTLGFLISPTETDGSSSILNGEVSVFGAMSEVGAFATSYIATTAAAATRLADSASITGTNFSQWYNQSEGTFVVVGDYSYIAAGNYGMVRADDGTENERIMMRLTSATQRLTIIDGGVEQCDISRTGVIAGTVFKHAAAYKDSDFAACINGGTVGTDAAGTIPTVTTLRLSGGNAGDYTNGHIQRLSYFRTRLPNATLQSIST